MYSKERGFTYPSPVGARPQSRASRVSVPPNYSGHAIVDGMERPLGVPAEEVAPPTERADSPVPRFDGLPRVSELGGSPRYGSGSRPLPVVTEEPPATPAEGIADLPTSPVSAAPAVSHSPHEGGLTSLRLLAGHGMGLEELLLLGLILFLLREGGECADRGDLDQTVILLGLLLLLG